MIALTILATGCPVIKVQPREVQENDKFCSYTIIEKKGTGEHNVNDIVCLLCKENVRWCKTEYEIKTGEVTYKLARVQDFIECRACHGSAVAIYKKQ